MLGQGMRRSGAAVLALAIGAAAPAEAASRLTGAYAFEVTWSVFPQLTLARGEARIRDLGDRYEMELTASARLAAPRIEWDGRYAVEGEGAFGEGRPTRFERRSERPDVTKTVVVSWAEPGAAPATDITLEPAGFLDERDPVDADAVRDVIDPLSFMGAVLRRVADTKGKSCDLELNVWDGEQLARIEIGTAESVVGARADCTLVYRDLKGGRRDTPWRAEESGTRRVLRIERTGLRWEPTSFTITGEFLGGESSFVTTITPLDR